MLPAAGQTGGSALEKMDAAHCDSAFRTLIEIAGQYFPPRKRQGVGDFFIWNAKVGTGLTPLRAVGLNAAAARPPMRQEMGGFMTEGSLQFRGAYHRQSRVQVDASCARLGRPCGAPHSVIPAHVDIMSPCGCTQLFQPAPDTASKHGVIFRSRHSLSMASGSSRLWVRVWRAPDV